jgi:hypothetical protein
LLDGRSLEREEHARYSVEENKRLDLSANLEREEHARY